jgi:hypothetical protein
MASNMSIKALLEKAFEPLRAFAERVDAQMEKKQFTPALATAGGSVPLKRATTSTLSLTGSAPPLAASPTARMDKFESSRRSPTAQVSGTQRGRTAPVPAARPAAPAPVPVAPAAPVATTLLEGPGGEFFKVQASTRFNAQVTTQAPDTAPVISRWGATLDIRPDGGVDVRDDQGRPYLSGQVVGVEPDGRALSLTVNYNLSRDVGQGTLFLGFTDSRLTYLSGSGTGRDEAGRTVVRDLASVAAKAPLPRPAASGTRPMGKTAPAAKSQKLGKR